MFPRTLRSTSHLLDRRTPHVQGEDDCCTSAEAGPARGLRIICHDRPPTIAALHEKLLAVDAFLAIKLLVPTVRATVSGVWRRC